MGRCVRWAAGIRIACVWAVVVGTATLPADAQPPTWPACVAAGLAVPPAPVPPSHPMAERPYAPLRGFDPDVALGIGHIAVGGGGADWSASLTLPLFAAPQAAPSGWLTAGWLIPAIGVPRAVNESGLVETGYEEVSLIVFEERSDGWVRLRVETGDDGVAWTHRCVLQQPTGALSVERWDTRFLSGEISPLYFRDRVRHALRAGPSVTDDRLQWVPADSDAYAMYPVEVRGDWMRIELAQPSDYCAEPSQAARESGWVRWRDDRAGPWVWYYTRGC